MRYRTATTKDWLKTGFYILLHLNAIVISLIFLLPFGPVGIAVWCIILGGSTYWLVRWHASNTVYRCLECEHLFEISTLTDLITPHFPHQKYLKCPQCGQTSWATIFMRCK
jgi:DNA-directed RNA polymerase subunit RPC12/RpoP